MTEQPTQPPDTPEIKLLILDTQHDGIASGPGELASWVERGWLIRKARPRVTTEGLKFLVVLEKNPSFDSSSPSGAADASALRPRRRRRAPDMAPAIDHLRSV